MAHNIGWRKGVTGLLLVTIALLLLNLHLLRLLVERVPDVDGQMTLTDKICADAAGPRQIYVPAYSHVYQDGLPMLMEIALSLRNTDPKADITIDSVDYFDDKGKLLRRYLKQPLILGPLMSAEYLVEKADFAGGMGANFLIAWSAPESPSPPLAEVLMIAVEKGQRVSWGSRGVEVKAETNLARCERRKPGA